ncbi:MAG TPA: phage terminase large subunit family protein, partial [Thermodesulfobacteriota bacterium]|nr:phage terminase large subunit family protein [Thermodesulfobacteriota bacterium]
MSRANTAEARSTWGEEERRGLKPPEELTVTEWSEKYVVLKRPVAEEEGPFRIVRTPYLAPIMNQVLDEDTETIVFCKSAQIAGTQGMINIIGFFATQESCSILLVLADQDTAEFMNTRRIQDMFKSSLHLEQYVMPEFFNKGEITLANGSYVFVAWASSVAKLASRPMRIVIFDEVDKPGYYVVTKEADPITLGMQRTEAKFSRKILILSTPTIEEGNIWKELNSCDVIYDWHVPCPFCGVKQPLRWSREHSMDFRDGYYRADDDTMRPLGQVVWQGGLKATPEQIEEAGYQCGCCAEIWSTLQKNQAVERGEMVSRFKLPRIARKVGYHVNRIYSLLGKSGDIPKLVREWIRVNEASDPLKLQGFINNTLAEPFVQKLDAPAEKDLLALRCDLPPAVVPQNTIALTCGIDVQQLGFYATVWAFSRTREAWLVHYAFLPQWEDVQELIHEAEFQVDGREQTVRIWRAAIDTGGGRGESEIWSRTAEIYEWLRLHGRRIAWGIKG